MSPLLFLLLAPQGPSFEQEVLPVLQEHCFRCHASPENGGPAQPKGRLRLDSPEQIRRGAGGEAVVAGYPEESVLWELVSLAEEDPDRMPPDRPRLAGEDLETIRAWIEAGADFGGWTGSRGEAGEEEPRPPARTPDRIQELQALAEGLPPLTEAQAEKLRSVGFLVSPVVPGTGLLRLTCYGREKTVNDDALRALRPFAPQIAVLHLGGTRVTDGIWPELARFERLVHLDLHQTQVQGEGLQVLQGLSHLRVLNLYGTQVGDLAAASLGGLTSLRSLYLWDCPLKEESIEALRKRLPGTRIIHSLELPGPAPPAEDRRSGR